jgi:cytochrome c biogenesis protein CcdA
MILDALERPQGRALAGLALGAFAGVALATLFWTTGLVRGEFVADWQSELTAVRTGPAVVAAMGVAFVIGASMVVLPCGFPAVFAIPTAMEQTGSAPARVRSLALFSAGAVVPLAAAGAFLGVAGEGLWSALGEGARREAFAAIAFSALGIAAMLYALAEFGLLRLQGLFVRVAGPRLPDLDGPSRRALVLGTTFGAGMGIACPMPTYYALLGWVVLAGSPLYGAAVLAAYGLGRVAVPIAVGLLVVGGLSRRAASGWLVRMHERVQWGSGLAMTTLGVFLLTLFGGFLGGSLL